ncbi:MAG: trypsin-like serine protease [Okeania sp. SIO3I5]|uniref:trypsin-like serine protease n=1 Tax=Okeania sp. SIO3I5 TaxID=2607805 RepID=UPI0013B98B6B|nr:trypsin-like serine protease [Okeania sp. SIO3I5]NEQ36033.1 trypsin-like serine protease [Okeania sp. SIO3I5]
MVAVSSNDPNDTEFIVPSDQFTGVVRFENTTTGEICTGALLAGDGLHILTAAHCFNNEDDSANLSPNPDDYVVTFELADGTFPEIDVEEIFIHPDWTANNSSDNDVAIIKLSNEAPDVESYEIYRDTDEIGETFTRVGYGLRGTGTTGQISSPEEDPPVKRFGQNTYDALSDIFSDPPNNLQALEGTQLAFDFDSGEPENDAFGLEYGLNQLGVEREVNSTAGDSGGPAFIDGQIAGFTSYGFSPSTDGIDVDDISGNSTFGEYSVDTRVSAYASFIDNILLLSQTGTRENDTLVGGTGNDTINGARGNDRLVGRDGDDLLIGRRGKDILLGGAGDDVLEGGIGRDRLNGGAGNDTLSGGGGIDRFIFNTNEQFQSEDVGIDEITDFSQTQEDILLLDLGTFTAIDSDSGTGFSIADEFATVANDGQAATSDAVIVYNSNNGNLFYNPNGNAAGFGSGGQFATLTNTVSLEAEDFFLRS